MISIFRTTVASMEDLNKIAPFLNALMEDLK
jgi:hypothetical protein